MSKYELGHADIHTRNGAVDEETILRETHSHIGRLKELSDTTFSGFAKLFGVGSKARILSSR